MSYESTRKLTTKVLSHFRFIRRCTYIATEVGVYNSDILAITPSNKLLEIEVKNSYEDFKNDFKKSYKKRVKNHIIKYKKFEVYASSKSSIWVPHYFYYAIPQELKDKVCKYIKDNNLPYGVICVDNEKISMYDKNVHCTVVIKGKRLHTRDINPKVIESICMRMSSELITRRQKLHCIMQKKEKV